MAGLLDFALGFGYGAAGGYAENKKADIQAQREANLARLQAQYQTEFQFKTARRVAELGTSDDPQDRATAGVMGFELEDRTPDDFLKTKEGQRLLFAVGGDREKARELLVQSEYTSEQEGTMTTASRTREQRIQDTIRTYPQMSRQDAVKVVDGLIDITTDEAGNRVAVDRTTMEAELLDVAYPEAPERSPMPDPAKPEEVAGDPEKGTGFAATAKGLYNQSIGQLPFAPTFMGVEVEAQRLVSIERDAIQAFASSGRPPVIEQERIMKMVPSALDWAQNPDVARMQLASLADIMALQYRSDTRSINDPRTDKSTKSDLRSRVNEIERVMSRLLTPEAAQRMLNTDVGGSIDKQKEGALNTYNSVQERMKEAGMESLPTIYSPSEFEQKGVKPGDRFIAPDGSIRVRPPNG